MYPTVPLPYVDWHINKPGREYAEYDRAIMIELRLISLSSIEASE